MQSSPTAATAATATASATLSQDALEKIEKYIEEEEGEMLPKAEHHDIDWDALEVKVTKRKLALLAKPDRTAKKTTAAKSSR